VGTALLRDDSKELESAARAPAHRPALQATARALRMAQHRLIRLDRLGPFDGRLRATAGIERVARAFEFFTPSQLESLVFCPFQFFNRYVLKLDTIDERDELEDDASWRGSVLHMVLERVHRQIQELPLSDTPNDTLWTRLEGTIDTVIAEQQEPPSAVERNLREIQAQRLRRTARQYAAQYDDYLQKIGDQVECAGVEVAFGPGTPSAPSLTLGQGDQVVRLSGTIDRIDVLRGDGEPRYRVIDYKSGHVPAGQDVTSGLMLQLPLYALAVQQLGLAAGVEELKDFGYWELRSAGYKPVSIPAWGPFRDQVTAFVLDTVGRLRQGLFPVHPRKAECTRMCDFRAVCRIAQVRAVGKVWTDAPKLEAGT
jgi:ATP-dependent helicase/DNAse subunit B